MTANPPKRSLKYRSVFISDVHLGYRGCRANYLLDFLKSIDTEYLYLVGDIVDGWSLKKSLYWPQEHNNVLRLILSKAKHGTRVIYVPGNHDEAFREYIGATFGNVVIHRDTVHTLVDGRKLLVLHGDEFDGAIKCGRLLGWVGHHAYDAILNLNRILNWARNACGFPYWSLAAYLKHKASKAVMHIQRFEQAAIQEARSRGLDGVVCGHIHRPNSHTHHGLHYMNCGDWVESCTALTEDHSGRIALLHWSERQHVIGESSSSASTHANPIEQAA
jgi:UDP-2,3-diacylglucosamine pyrophosphatase LpxH